MHKFVVGMVANVELHMVVVELPAGYSHWGAYFICILGHVAGLIVLELKNLRYGVYVA